MLFGARPPQFASVLIVHVEQLNRATTDGRAADDSIAIDGEVFWPLVNSRIEQFDRYSVYIRRHIRAFVVIAPMAREAQVRYLVAALVLDGNDVVNVKCDEGELILEQSAILAPVAGTFTHKSA